MYATEWQKYPAWIKRERETDREIDRYRERERERERDLQQQDNTRFLAVESFISTCILYSWSACMPLSGKNTRHGLRERERERERKRHRERERERDRDTERSSAARQHKILYRSNDQNSPQEFGRIELISHFVYNLSSSFQSLVHFFS